MAQNHAQERGLWDRVFGMFPNRRREDIITQITNNPESIPRVYVVDLAIRAAKEFERLRVTERIGEANEHLRVARELANYIYNRMDKDESIVFPQNLMDDETTNTGALGLMVDPNREYRDAPGTYLLLKQVKPSEGRQAFADSRHFQDNTRFNLEGIASNVPFDNETSYLWKEFIVGPNLSTLFQTLDNGIRRGSEEEMTLSSQLEEALSDIATRRVLYWQQHAPDLIDVPMDPELVIRDYKINFAEVLRGFSQFTDVDYTQQELDEFRQALDSIDFSFVNSNTTVRNVAATYRNMILATGKINISYPEVVELFISRGGGRLNRDALEERLYFVDTPAKYSHALEDPWEMDLSPEGSAKRHAVAIVDRSYRDNESPFTARESRLMGAYRAYRKAFLGLTKYVQKNFERNQRGEIGDGEYEANLSKYRTQINHLLQEGQTHLDVVSRLHVPPTERDSFDVISSALQKLSTYTTIDYPNTNSINTLN